MSLLLVTLDSIIFKEPQQYAVQVKWGPSHQQTLASKHKTVAPLFNKNCCAFHGFDNLNPQSLTLSVSKNMGSSLQHLGESQELNLQDCLLKINQVWTRSLPIYASNMTDIATRQQQQNAQGLQKQEQIGRINVSIEITNSEEYAAFRMQNLAEKVKIDRMDPVEDLAKVKQNQNLEPSEQNPWILEATIRSAENLPLNTSSEHGLPSAFVNLAWSPSMHYQDRITDWTQSTETKIDSTSPMWNQVLTLVGSNTYPLGNNDNLTEQQYDQTTPQPGFAFLSIMDRVNGQKLDEFTIPLNFLEPYRTINIQVQILEGKGTFYLSLVLKTIQAMDNPVDPLVIVALRSVDFDPLPVESKFYSIMLAQKNLRLGTKIPLFQCDTRDEQSFSRAFYNFKTQVKSGPLTDQELASPNQLPGKILFLTKAFSFQRAGTKEEKNALMACRIAQSALDDVDCSLYLVAQSATGTTPLEIVGTSSDPINVELNSLLMAEDARLGRSEVISLRSQPQSQVSSLCAHFAHVRTTVQIQAFHIDQEALEFVDDVVGVPLNEEQKRMISKGDAGVMGQSDRFDFFDSKQRWQMLSRELAQKQELIHQTLRKTQDIESQVQEKGAEVVTLRHSVRYNQSKLVQLRSQLADEEAIEQQVSQSQFQQSISNEATPGLNNSDYITPGESTISGLGDLRKELVSTSLAFKVELQRNTEFEQKLDNALRQLDRKDPLLKEISKKKDKLQVSSQKLLRLQKEESRESRYIQAVEKQEQVIHKLELLLEESVTTAQKRLENQGDINLLDVQIGKLMDEKHMAEIARSKTDLHLQIAAQTESNLLLQEKLDTKTAIFDEATNIKNQYKGWKQEQKDLEHRIEREKAKIQTFLDEMKKEDEKFEQQVETLTNLFAQKQEELEHARFPEGRSETASQMQRAKDAQNADPNVQNIPQAQSNVVDTQVTQEEGGEAEFTQARLSTLQLI